MPACPLVNKKPEILHPGEPFFDLPAEFDGTTDLSKILPGEASTLLGVDPALFCRVFCCESQTPCDIRLVCAVKNNLDRPDADPLAYAIAALRWECLSSGLDPSAALTAPPEFDTTTNIFRHPRHIEPRFPSRAAAVTVVLKALDQCISRMPKEEIRHGFSFSLYACYKMPVKRSKAARKKGGASAVQESVDADHTPAVEIAVRIGGSKKGKDFDYKKEVLDEIRRGMILNGVYLSQKTLRNS